MEGDAGAVGALCVGDEEPQWNCNVLLPLVGASACVGQRRRIRTRAVSREPLDLEIWRERKDSTERAQKRIVAWSKRGREDVSE